MSWNWSSPPGERRDTRATARKLLVSLMVGMLSIGVAWAGTGLVPVNSVGDNATVQEDGDDFVGMSDGDGGEASASALTELQPGQIYAGSAKVSLYPEPEKYQELYPGAAWERDRAKCATLSPSQEAFNQTAKHVADFRVRWAENPNCLYMGGYGLGPMNPITEWDEEYGLWSRSVAMQDAQGDTLVLTLIDAVYWEAHYNTLCPGEPRSPADNLPKNNPITDEVEKHDTGTQDCGFLDLAQSLAEETGLKPESFVFASTHSHTAMDFIGGWGAVPEWYMHQATESLKASVRSALGSLEPAVLEAGESIVRGHNSERRDFYRSAEENTVSWFRLIDADDQPRPEVCTTPEPEPTPDLPPGQAKKTTPPPPPEPVCTPAAPGKAIATVGAYAAHPVTEDESGGEADADFPAVFAKSVEDRFGGTGMFLQSGLGNVSPRSGEFATTANACADGVDNDGDGRTDYPADIGCNKPDDRGNVDRSEYSEKEQIGFGLSSYIPAIGGGEQIVDANVRVGRTYWDQPVTNSALSALGTTGFFDRTMNRTPAAISVGKGGEENKKCKSASPISVNTSVSAAKIGSLWITGGPGELFSNLSNTIEEKNEKGVTLALGLVNDGLGYVIQNFETDHAGRQALGFAGKAGPVGLAEYEDAYSIDHCFGDATVEYTLQLLNTL